MEGDKGIKTEDTKQMIFLEKLNLSILRSFLVYRGPFREMSG
jgi:hypothetical protein